jgi:hypothetical protein
LTTSRRLSGRRSHPKFDDIAADELTLWKVAIPVGLLASLPDKKKLLDSLQNKTKLDEPRTSLSSVFPSVPAGDEYVFVQPPLSGIATLCSIQTFQYTFERVEKVARGDLLWRP